MSTPSREQLEAARDGLYGVIKTFEQLIVDCADPAGRMVLMKSMSEAEQHLTQIIETLAEQDGDSD